MKMRIILCLVTVMCASVEVAFGRHLPESGATAPAPEEVCDALFVNPDVMPRFEGKEIKHFRNWVEATVKYPKEANEKGVSGRVVVSFVINKRGTLTDIKVVGTPDRSLAKETVRILKASPKWTPGTRLGRVFPFRLTIPVDFNLPD